MGATVEQKKRVAEWLRRNSGDAGTATLGAFRAVADELDPPAPREVVVQGRTFRYDQTATSFPWSVSDSTNRFTRLSGALNIVGFTPTPDEYRQLWNLQHTPEVAD